MAISRTWSKKAPSQNPVDFYECKQSGGPLGKGGASVPDKLTSPAPRERVYGRKDLGDSK